MSATLPERYRGPHSTRALRELKNAVLVATQHEPGCVTHSVALHFFKDCWIGFHRKSMDGRMTKSYGVYSKDFGKTWALYCDQFEPAEGFHRMVEYSPSDASFPTTEVWSKPHE